MNIGDVYESDLLLLMLHLLSEALLVGEGVRQSVAVTHLAKPGVVVVVGILVVVVVLMVMILVVGVVVVVMVVLVMI